MNIYGYEEAFGAWDVTTRPMRKAMKLWRELYYGKSGDSCQRVAFTVVSKLTRGVFGEYAAHGQEPFVRQVLKSLEACSREAMERILMTGECFLKPWLRQGGFGFTLVPRDQVLVFSRDAQGAPMDVGLAERSVLGNQYYTLLERRTVTDRGLRLENRLYRSNNPENLGARVALNSHPDYAGLQEYALYPGALGLGMVRVKTPMVNCVDGSRDGVSVYAPAAELIQAIEENERQLQGEFRRGQSRIIASADLLRRDEQGNRSLDGELFVGLDEDPEQVGITIFAPELRQEAYLQRKQEYLRNVETIVGLKRGMLSDSNARDRTATEITASAGDYNLTLISLQGMWEQAIREALELCRELALVFGLPEVPDSLECQVDWGNGILYDEDKTWEEYKQMVAQGLLKPELALAWRFGCRAETQQELEEIRKRYMP